MGRYRGAAGLMGTEGHRLPDPIQALPLHKGWYGVDYRSKIGLHRAATGPLDGTVSPDDPVWDFYVGPLPFLTAINDDRPYLRETVPVRKDRLDNARDPGDQSLDSNVWMRSWTSWHLGGGQRAAEPLETSPDIARFRFDRSFNVSPWEAGELSLLRGVDERVSSAYRCIGVDGVGLVVSTPSGVRVLGDGVDRQVSSSVVRQIMGSAVNWAGIDASGDVLYGDYATSTDPGAVIPGIADPATALNFAKDRLWVGAGRVLYEVVSPSTDAVEVHTFNAQSTIVDIDSGSGGLYVLVNDGQSRIYVVSVQDDGSLNVPREVAVLPRGESGNFLYGYLGRYLVIGTSEGVRIADAGTLDTLPMGPVIIPMVGGCVDATANGRFLWVTAGLEGVDTTVDGDVQVPGLYRMDLSRVTSDSLDPTAARYAYATDLTAPSGQRTVSVSHAGGRVWFITGSLSGAGVLWSESDDPVDSGWFTTGLVEYATAELKAWLSTKVSVRGDGWVALQGNTGAGWIPITSSLVATPFSGDTQIDTSLHPASPLMDIEVLLVRNVSSSVSPVLESLGLRASPAPARRNRYIRIPLLCLDNDVDRNNSRVGYAGFGYDRMSDLEKLEETGSTVTVRDVRTGESVRCQIDKVQFEGSAPPSRARSNSGGILTVTLMTV